MGRPALKPQGGKPITDLFGKGETSSQLACIDLTKQVNAGSRDNKKTRLPTRFKLTR